MLSMQTGGNWQGAASDCWHLPRSDGSTPAKAQQEGEQERRKAALIPCPHHGPVRGAACLCGLAMCGAEESAGSHLHLPATL